MERDLDLLMKPAPGLPITFYGAGTSTGTGQLVNSFESVYLWADVVLMGTTATIGLETSDSLSSGYVAVPGTTLVIDDTFNGNRTAVRRIRTATLRAYVRVTATIAGGTPIFGATLVFYDPNRGEDQNVTYLAPA